MMRGTDPTLGQTPDNPGRDFVVGRGAGFYQRLKPTSASRTHGGPAGEIRKEHVGIYGALFPWIRQNQIRWNRRHVPITISGNLAAVGGIVSQVFDPERFTGCFLVHHLETTQIAGRSG